MLPGMLLAAAKDSALITGGASAKLKMSVAIHAYRNPGAQNPTKINIYLSIRIIAI